MTTSTCWTVSLDVEVFDVGRLHDAALALMIGDDWTEADARDHLRNGREIDIGVCLRMILDPGISPDGCKLIQSAAEEAA